MGQAGYKTIFAIATPPGRSAIAVIRISGPLAGDAPALFGAACPPAGQFLVTRLVLDQLVIDQVILLFMILGMHTLWKDFLKIKRVLRLSLNITTEQ